MNQEDLIQNAYYYLRTGEYDKAIELYEFLLEQEPERLEFYIYLGLVYLLQGEEQQAQLTWFMALNQEMDQDEQNFHTLIGVLDYEAEQQELAEKYQIAWLIRGHIHELNPKNIINLMKLIWLDVKVGNRTVEKLNDWGVIELLREKSEAELPKELMIKVLNQILYFPEIESVDFAEACLNYSQYLTSNIYVIVEMAIKMFNTSHYVSFGIDLIKICLIKKPDDPELLYHLGELYNSNSSYKEAIKVATQFFQQSKSASLSTQLISSHQLFRGYIVSSNWTEISPIANQHKELLKTIFAQENIDFNHYEKTCLHSTGQFFLYIQDNLQENRFLCNRLGDLLQKEIIFKKNILVEPIKRLEKKNLLLKIGYIGTTFRCHSVGWLCRWLINHHDRENFEIYLYSLKQYTDDITQEYFINQVKQFFICDRDVENTVKKIQEDEIDILIDLDSMTNGPVCHVMLRKPAPIQITWLGMDASGIPTIDYFIADPYVLPENAQDYYREKIWRLPHTYLGIDGFEVGVPTLKREDLGISDDGIIFLNVQNAQKRHPDTVRLQMRILRAVPNSYLLIKGLGEKEITERFFAQIAQEEGIEIERLRFLERDQTEFEHRANLTIADVILDTYPYNGATTTLEALWVGIPIVTRVGEQFAARNSYTFMINAGITEGIARNEEEYIEWGIKLGTDENLRREISWKLHQSRQNSPLWDGKQFAREMEKAYQQMWETYIKNI